MVKTVAIITARGGSKRIPGKNIKEFCGKPIIAYSIQAALDSQLFDAVMVSTDDEKIADVEWYCEYPLETTVYIGGKESKVLFNAWVKYKDGTEEYQGVAYLCSSDDSKDHVKVACQSAWCLQNDVNFVFRNEKNIETGPFYIRNISLLAARARRFTACGVNAE
ncbi:cytidylyltransferase domain-containing protein [Butyrivibrio sp. YAB3001]|uniref:cytidylyltransferase domain-containing protein n=1 Tax=Butyrivibrio sp. YAB3001 TaxID=1520812 RepID=UPI0008F62657|nr:hypothetical protein [Butyrivibrio sp. YAB3001]SFC46971.1 Cytidylyltransferase [Butyrivibrio sp. YAB3001]